MAVTEAKLRKSFDKAFPKYNVWARRKEEWNG